MSLKIIWKRASSKNTKPNDSGLELHTDLGSKHDHVITISKQLLTTITITFIAIVIFIATGFYRLGANQTNPPIRQGNNLLGEKESQAKKQDQVVIGQQRDAPEKRPALSYHLVSYESLIKKNQNSSLQELQFEIAKMKGTIEEMNILKEKFANLAMPGPLKNALQKNASGHYSTSNLYGGPNTQFAGLPATKDIVNSLSIINKPGTKGLLAPVADKDLTATFKDVALMNERLQKTESKWLQELNLLSQLPTGLPIENNAGLSSNYGSRIDPFTNLLSYHSGVDFSAPVGTTIYASGDGKVLQTDFDRSNGQYIVIEHAEGFTSKYAHLSRFMIRHGEPVKRGQAIAQVGSTGRSTSPHLHYEIAYKGTTINPMEALSQKPTQAAITGNNNKKM